MKIAMLFFCLGMALILGGYFSSLRLPPIGIHPGELRMPDTLEVGDPAPDFKLRNRRLAHLAESQAWAVGLQAGHHEHAPLAVSIQPH
jgi:hypothetical protein